MQIFQILAILTFASGVLGIFVLWHEAAWKLSSETTGSPKIITRWSYRYFIFFFWFMLSFLSVGPLTTWQLIKIPAVQVFGREHAWLIFALTIPPALLLYYLHRQFVRWADPRKLEGRKKLAARVSRSGR